MTWSVPSERAADPLVSSRIILPLIYVGLCNTTFMARIYVVYTTRGAYIRGIYITHGGVSEKVT